MPEEALETQDLKESLEGLEEGHESSSTRWTMWLSLSTALLAVLAAVASLESGACANDAILDKNDAVLHQSKADDAWAHYQAMSVKAVVYATQSESTPSADLARKWRGEAEREKGEQKDVKVEAEREEAFVERDDHGAEHALHLHHQFAKSVTIFQVSIALAAIAALVRRKPMWWLSLAIGAVGTVFFAMGFLHA
jgi:hypothetical protein